MNFKTKHGDFRIDILEQNVKVSSSKFNRPYFTHNTPKNPLKVHKRTHSSKLLILFKVLDYKQSRCKLV